MTRPWVSWTKEEEALLVEIYPTFKREDISAVLSRHKMECIWAKASQLGLKKSTYKYSGRRVHDPIWDFWDSWSNDLAYLVGLLAADGTVLDTHHQHGVNLTLQKRDGYILNKIRIIAGGYTYEQERGTSWRLSGIDVTRRLGELGLVPRKTSRLIVPEIPEIYRSHFVRGYFDGDGTIGEYRVQRGTTHRIGFCGCEGFMISLRSLIANALSADAEHILGRPVSKILDTNVWTLIFSRRPVVNHLIQWMYKDAGLFLERKKKTADYLNSRFLEAA